jgi:hypothetical protein
MANHPIITEVTYDELIALITGSQLEPGLQYLITDYRTVHWMVNYDYDGGINYIYAPTYDTVPAPGNISVTPDAVGDNPVTWYYKACYFNDSAYKERRSAFSVESSYQEGDSTTSVMFNCDAIPAWATEVIIFRGATSGVYSELVDAEGVPQELYNTFIESPGAVDTVSAFGGDKIVVTGDVEPLLVTALDVDQLELEAQSMVYPTDKISYRVGTLPITGLIPFRDYFTFEEVPGYKGLITYREDTVNCLKAPLDWRVFTYRKYTIDQPAWEEKEYNSGDFVSCEYVIYKAIASIEDTCQVSTITLKGTVGEAVINIDGAFNRNVVFNSDLTTTASDFVTAYAADYSAIGITLTADTGLLVFTASVAATPFNAPTIAQAEGLGWNLTGVVSTVASRSVTETPDTSNRWKALYNTYNSSYLSYHPNYLPNGTVNLNPDIEDFLDVTVFGESCYNIDISDGRVCLQKVPFLTFYIGCTNMTFGSGCYAMTFGSNCYYLTFDSGCGYMTFGSNCNALTFYIGCTNMTFGSGCYTMTFGAGCGNMTFGSGCYTMTFGAGCGNMTFGSGCYTMTFGAGCGNITFGSGCYTMTFGASCNAMTFGSNCYYLTFDSGCGYMTFGSNCYDMTFGSNCNAMTFVIASAMTFGSNCNNMTFGSYCSSMTFGSGCYNLILPDYAAFNDFKDGCMNVDFTDSEVDIIIDGRTVTHQRVSNTGIKIVQSYLNYDTDHYEMVYAENTIGIGD